MSFLGLCFFVSLIYGCGYICLILPTVNLQSLNSPAMLGEPH